jgi:hypothetical protein
MSLGLGPGRSIPAESNCLGGVGRRSYDEGMSVSYLSAAARATSSPVAAA